MRRIRFLVNHFGDLTFTASLPSSEARVDDDVVDTCVRPLRSAPPSGDAPCAGDQWAVTDWHPSVPRIGLGQNAPVALHHERIYEPELGQGPAIVASLRDWP